MNMTFLEIVAIAKDYMNNHAFPAITNIKRDSQLEDVFDFDIELQNLVNIADGTPAIRFKNLVYQISATAGAQLIVPDPSLGTSRTKHSSSATKLNKGDEVSEYFLYPKKAEKDKDGADILDAWDRDALKGLQVKAKKPAKEPGPFQPPQPGIVVKIHGDLDRDALLEYLFPTKQTSQTVSKNIFPPPNVPIPEKGS